MSRKKKIQVVLSAILLLGIVGSAALEILARTYRQRASTYLKAEFSQRSDLHLNNFTTSVSVWAHFPRLTFTFHNIKLTDTTSAVPLPVLSVKQASVKVPLSQFWPGRLRISEVDLNQVVFRQQVDKFGNKKGLLFRPASDTDSTAARSAFVIPRIVLRNASIIRENEFKQSVFSLQIRRADLSAQSGQNELQLKGQLTGNIGYIGTRNRRLLQREAFTADGNYKYHFGQKKGVFTRTHAVLNGNKLNISGWHAKIAKSPNSRVHILLAGKQPVFFLVKQIMPARADSLRARVSSGSHVLLSYRITGASGPRQRPRSQLNFALHNGTFFVPATRTYIRGVNLKGNLDNGLQQAPVSSRFTLSEASARFGKGYIRLQLQIDNFSKPHFRLQTQSQLTLADLAGLLSSPDTKNATGTLAANFDVEGFLPPSPATDYQQWRSKGYIRVADVQFKPAGSAVTYRSIKGYLQFKDNQIQLKNLSGTLAGHPFSMQATIQNYFAYLFQQPNLVQSNVTVKARHFDVNWLPKTLFSPTPKSTKRDKKVNVNTRLTTGQQQPQYTLTNERSTPAGAKQMKERWWLPGQTQLYLQVNTVQLPGHEKIKNLTVQVQQNNQRIRLTGMRFTTSSGGTATANGGFRFTTAGIRQPYLNVQLHYPFLDLQTFMRDIASLKTYEQPLGNTAPSRSHQHKNAYFKENDYQLNLRVTANKLKYQYLHGSDLLLTASLNRQRAKLQDLQLRSFGGRIAARGQIRFDDRVNTLPVKLRAQVEQIDLQQLFTIADNMQLDVLNSQNIRGTVNCNLSVTTELDSTFAPSFDRTVAYAKANFRNMELIEVVPIQNALRFLRKERTRHLFFEDVHTHFLLRNHEFITPGLNLNNNLAALALSGNYIMRGPAKLNLDVNILNVLFGNNQRRIDKIQQTDSVSEQKEVRGQHLILVRQDNKYKIKLSSKKERETNVQSLNQEFRRFLQQYQIDTVFTMQRQGRF